MFCVRCLASTDLTRCKCGGAITGSWRQIPEFFSDHHYKHVICSIQKQELQKCSCGLDYQYDCITCWAKQRTPPTSPSFISTKRVCDICLEVNPEKLKVLPDRDLCGECFRCGRCDGQISNEYFQEENLYFHKTCMASMCIKCNEVVEDEFVKTQIGKMHPAVS